MLDSPVKYFAYGSNMDCEQMAVRCPQSRVLGKGILPAYRFRIDGRGYATVDEDLSGSVQGIVWALSQEDEKNLDRYEGVPRYYTKQIVQVEHGEIREPMLIYVSTNRLKGKPRTGYLERILLAAQAHGFLETYVEELKSWHENIQAPVCS